MNVVVNQSKLDSPLNSYSLIKGKESFFNKIISHYILFLVFY